MLLTQLFIQKIEFIWHLHRNLFCFHSTMYYKLSSSHFMFLLKEYYFLINSERVTKDVLCEHGQLACHDKVRLFFSCAGLHFQQVILGKVETLERS